ncbi:MAG: hypothetical protein V7L25_16155 [Nostoc sp.]|uniref:hypothetical protein n=1 Tax=Nostoc sp. TaxID=1180 RepID=UPI002FF0CAA9
MKLAGLDNFPYKTQFTQFTGGNLMVQAINANAIDIASCSETPPIFAIGTQDAVKIIAATRAQLSDKLCLCQRILHLK